MRVAVYRNLNAAKADGGMSHDEHAWSVCAVGASSTRSYGKKLAQVNKRQQLLLLNAQACYNSKDKQVQTTNRRAVFAWFKGIWTAPSAVAYKVGRRLGMSPKERGEFRFVYADNRQPCPAIMAGVLFTAQGAFEVTL